MYLQTRTRGVDTIAQNMHKYEELTPYELKKVVVDNMAADVLKTYKESTEEK